MQRMTSQRKRISELLERLDVFVTAQQLHDLLTQSGEKIGLATVYRTLQTFVEHGRVEVIHSEESDVLLYRSCHHSDHHHHLVCRECGAAIEIPGEGLESWMSNILSDYGYTDITHIIEFYGLCPECSAKMGDDDAADGEE